MQTLGNKREEAVAYERIGSVRMSEYKKAKERYEKALPIAIEIGDRKEQGTTNRNLGTVYESLGEYQKAKEYCQKALAIAKEIGDRKLEGEIDAKLGAVFHSAAEIRRLWNIARKHLPLR